jgi:glycosyltransferase involved in cell wall biosynthesis
MASELAATSDKRLVTVEPSRRDFTVLVVPTWYPSPLDPVNGVFVAEQVRALANLRPEWRIAVSTWGQGDAILELRRPLASLRRVPSVIASGRVERQIAQNACEYVRPVLHWTHRVRSGRLGAILAANRANAIDAATRFGPIDVIHAHASVPAGWIAMHLSEELGIPYVVTEHVGEDLQADIERTRFGRSLFRDPLVNADACIAVSRELEGRLRRSGVHGVATIPNLVDEDFFTPGPPGDAGPVVFALARLEEAKGILELLHAVARLRAGGYSGLEVRIGGTGPRRRAFQAKARELGVDDCVSWLGPISREAVRDELRACRCLVLPSRAESFSVVCVEAMACGRPVVATRCGGPNDIVTPETGVLVDVGDSVALSEALASVLASTSFDTDVIRREAVEHYSRPLVVDAIEAVYRRVLDARGQA